MADIVNLNKARKDKARRERDSEADANRRRFGRTRAQKQADRDVETRARKTIDDRRLEPGDTPADKPDEG
jgi:hypothetical protein